MAKIRLRNVTTGELRDVDEGSDEHTALDAAVYSHHEESRPLWVLGSRVMQPDEGIDPTLQVSFGQTGLPPLTQGEVEAGIKTPEQKARELGLLDDTDEDEEEETAEEETTEDEDEEEEEETDDDDDEEEEEEEEEPPTPPPAARRRRAAAPKSDT